MWSMFFMLLQCMLTTPAAPAWVTRSLELLVGGAAGLRSGELDLSLDLDLLVRSLDRARGVSVRPPCVFLDDDGDRERCCPLAPGVGLAWVRACL